MRKTAAILPLAAAIALAACSSASSSPAPPGPDLLVTCRNWPAGGGDPAQLIVIISQVPAGPSPRAVYVHTVTLDLPTQTGADRYVTEKIDRWVPYGPGITVTLPGVLEGGYVPGCSSGGSWS